MNDQEKGARLLEMVRGFVKKYEIRCPESVMQRDDPQEDAPEFVADLCEVAGFFRDTE